MSGRLRRRDGGAGDVAPERGNLRDRVAQVARVAYEPAPDDRAGTTDTAPAMHVHRLALRKGGVDLVQDPGHVRDRRRAEVDDRMRRAPCTVAEQSGVGLERVGRVCEVDEQRDAAPLERSQPSRRNRRVGGPGVLAREQPVGHPVAVANRDLHAQHAAYASLVDADPVELRVLGCLLEKQRTTPDQYPLSLNALRLACNQTTNRDPIVAYDEREIHEALQRLARRGWTRLASGAGSRAAKYRQLFDEALGLADDAIAVLCVLLLRGPQTPGELNQRTGRLHAFTGLAEIQATLDGLAGRELVERLERRPGQKEERYRHLLGADATAPAARPERGITAAAGSQEDPGGLAARVDALEAEVARLREALSALGAAGRAG